MQGEYDSMTKDVGVTGRPSVPLGNKMEEYHMERNWGRTHGMVYAREVCKDRHKLRLFC